TIPGNNDARHARQDSVTGAPIKRGTPPVLVSGIKDTCVRPALSRGPSAPSACPLNPQRSVPDAPASTLPASTCCRSAKSRWHGRLTRRPRRSGQLRQFYLTGGFRSVGVSGDVKLVGVEDCVKADAWTDGRFTLNESRRSRFTSHPRSTDSKDYDSP